MKRRSRELNIFSMSALDLFASGMGAFILVTVMALPFFPNTGDAGEDVEVVQAALEDARRQRDEARRQLSEAQRQRDQARSQRDEAVRQRNQASRNSPTPDEPTGQAEEAQRQLEQAEERLRLAEERLAESERQLADARRRMEAAERNAREAEDALVELRIPDLDIVICLDVSGSMEDEIDGLKREVADLAKVLDTLAPSTGIGIVAFGDRRWRQPIHVQPILGLSSLPMLERFVRGLVPNMNDPRADRNSDYPEALATALDRAVALNWRPVSRRRYIVVVSDASAYPEREAAAIQAARSFASVEGQTVSTVMVLDPRTDPTYFMRALADAGNGSFVDATGGETMLASLLLAILKS